MRIALEERAVGAPARDQAYAALREAIVSAELAPGGRFCELSGREVAWRLSQRTRGQLDRIRRLSMPEPGYGKEMIAEHRTVLEAVAARDPKAAEHTLRHHLRMVLSYVPDIHRAHPEYF